MRHISQLYINLHINNKSSVGGHIANWFVLRSDQISQGYKQPFQLEDSMQQQESYLHAEHKIIIISRKRLTMTFHVALCLFNRHAWKIMLHLTIINSVISV